jgi:hypothetical protein
VPASSLQRFSRSARFPRSDAEIPPGPDAGRIWRDPPAVTCDKFSGRTITRLTSYRGHSHHLVGSAPLWLDDGHRLLVVSDRAGHSHLFLFDFSAVTLTQLTDLRSGERPAAAEFVSPGHLRFLYGRAGYELDLASLRMRATPSRSPPRLPHPRRSLPALSAALARPASALGETPLTDGHRLLWLTVGRTRRALACLAGSGLAAHALAAPCLRPGGDQAIFVSDASGYAQLYSVDTRQPATLPLASAFIRSARSPRSASAASVPRPTPPPA